MVMLDQGDELSLVIVRYIRLSLLDHVKLHYVQVGGLG